MRMYEKLALLLALLAASTHDLAAETLKVAVAQRGFWNNTFIDVGLKQGYFRRPVSTSRSSTPKAAPRRSRR